MFVLLFVCIQVTLREFDKRKDYFQHHLLFDSVKHNFENVLFSFCKQHIKKMGCICCRREKATSTRVNSFNFHQKVFDNLESERSLALPSSTRRTTDRQRRPNLESHQIVWLDVDEKLPIKIETLRNLVDYSTIFNDEDECRRFLDDTNDSATFLVLCSNSTAESLRTKMEQLKNIKAIYRYSSTNTISNVRDSVRVTFLRNSTSLFVRFFRMKRPTRILTSYLPICRVTFKNIIELKCLSELPLLFQAVKTKKKQQN
jgi:hypothetical protein